MESKQLNELRKELTRLTAQRNIDAKAARKARDRTTGKITGPVNRSFAASLEHDLEKLDKRIDEVAAEIDALEKQERQ